MANLDKALAEYRAKVSVNKQGHNPFFGNDYYMLEDILNAIADSHEHGIYWGQYIVDDVLYTKVSTDTDERISSHRLPTPTAENHQKIASQITYMKRIHLITMFGICEPDDDGNSGAAAGGASVSSRQQRKVAAGDPSLSSAAAPIVNEL